MDAYIYQADLLCEDCANDIIGELKAKGVEDTGDSDDYPQGPYADGGGEADSPQHCGYFADCINAESFPDREKRVGIFLENPLTQDGMDYVRTAIMANPDDSLHQVWADFYDI